MYIEAYACMFVFCLGSSTPRIQEKRLNNLYSSLQNFHRLTNDQTFSVLQLRLVTDFHLWVLAFE